MDTTIYLDAVRAMHLLGLSVGLGLALLADVCAAKSFFRPVGKRDLEILQLLHIGVTIGLGLLWVSGLALLHYRTGFDPNAVSPKLFAKLVIVVLLTGNAVVITTYAMPLLHLTRGTRFVQNEMKIRLELASVAGISLGCWLCAFALGTFSQLKSMGAAEIGQVLGLIFLATTLPALLIGALAPRIERLVLRGPDAPSQDPAWKERLAEQAAKPARIVPGLLTFPFRDLAMEAARKVGRK